MGHSWVGLASGVRHDPRGRRTVTACGRVCTRTLGQDLRRDGGRGDELVPGVAGDLAASVVVGGPTRQRCDRRWRGRLGARRCPARSGLVGRHGARHIERSSRHCPRSARRTPARRFAYRRRCAVLAAATQLYRLARPRRVPLPGRPPRATAVRRHGGERRDAGRCGDPRSLRRRRANPLLEAADCSVHRRGSRQHLRPGVPASPCRAPGRRAKSFLLVSGCSADSQVVGAGGRVVCCAE